MASTIEPDFDIEYAKHLAKGKLFEETFEKKRELAAHIEAIRIQELCVKSIEDEVLDLRKECHDKAAQVHKLQTVFANSHNGDEMALNQTIKALQLSQDVFTPSDNVMDCLVSEGSDTWTIRSATQQAKHWEAECKSRVEKTKTQSRPCRRCILLGEKEEEFKVEKATLADLNGLVDTFKDAANRAEQTWRVEWGRALQLEVTNVIAARQQERGRLEPLVSLGVRIRNRKLEWAKEEKLQDKEVIGLGDAASHYGAALADAMVSDMAPRKTPSLFERSYGVNKEFVLEHRSCKRLMDMLDWRGSIPEFTISSDSPSMERLTFDAHFKDFKNSAVYHWDTEKIEKHLNDNVGGQTTYNKLKESYTALLAEHKLNHAAKKEKHRR
ncbi:uncharacterized protein PAC_04682 [Phialocephala subalpina]|uniref:Uncharacterized protein n=1 Tax=Phialocephala subalpina TaxID=576137 RepID=A0A1L7WPV1_9HELO|nr:uncharacterized protein PAC_04682 [Phialocephala subalpina]